MQLLDWLIDFDCAKYQRRRWICSKDVYLMIVKYGVGCQVFSNYCCWPQFLHKENLIRQIRQLTCKTNRINSGHLKNAYEHMTTKHTYHHEWVSPSSATPLNASQNQRRSLLQVHWSLAKEKKYISFLTLNPWNTSYYIIPVVKMFRRHLYQ